MDIKDKIRQIRESKGFTQEDIADKLGVTRANYRYFENRGNKLTIEQLGNIASALGVSMADILGYNSESNNSQEVEQLRKRNEELEDRIEEFKDRIKDKNDKISDLKIFIEKIKDTLLYGMGEYIKDLDDCHFLKIQFLNGLNGENSQEIDANEYFALSKDEKDDKYQSVYESFRFVISVDDISSIIKLLHRDRVNYLFDVFDMVNSPTRRYSEVDKSVEAAIKYINSKVMPSEFA